MGKRRTVADTIRDLVIATEGPGMGADAPPPCWCCALWGLNVPGTVPSAQGGPFQVFRNFRGRMCQTCADAVTVQADADRHLAEEERRRG